jgi:hypothetical protein
MSKGLVIKSNILEFKSVAHRSVKIIQGDLKELTRENYQKFKKKLLKDGICRPAVLWKNEKNELCVLDGTQMVRTLEAMENEGFKVPLMPSVLINASDEKAAREILLSLISQYGTVTTQGLVEFAGNIGLDLPDLQNDFNIPGINFKTVSDEYTKDHTDKEKTQKKLTKCPKCEYEF